MGENDLQNYLYKLTIIQDNFKNILLLTDEIMLDYKIFKKTLQQIQLITTH